LLRLGQPIKKVASGKPNKYEGAFEAVNETIAVVGGSREIR